MSSAQDSILSNNFLLLLAALMQQQQQQQQQQHQHQQHQQQQNYQQKQLLQQQQQMRLLQQQQQQQHHHINLAQIHHVPSQQPQQATPPQQHPLSCHDLSLHLLQQQHNEQQQKQFQQQQQRALSLRLLESLFSMNQEPGDDAIDLIAQKINSTSSDVANWFQLRREADRNLLAQQQQHNNNNHSIINNNSNNCISPMLQPISFVNHHNNNNLNHYDQTSLGLPLNDLSPLTSTILNVSNKLSCNSNNNNNSTNASTTPILSAPTTNSSNNTATTPTTINNNSISPSTSPSHQLPASANTAINCPSSTLLAKLNAVTTRSNAHIVANKLDSKMIDLLEALYAINDNPEPAAIEMIARRVNVSVETLTDWFDKKRLKLNPFAGPRSPPAKKREGGRVVTFSEYQRSLLEAIFDENNYLHPQEYEELSNLIQVPSRNIKIWFKNRRSKQRLSGRIAD